MNPRYQYEYNNITTINNGGIHTLKYQSSKPNALTDHNFENLPVVGVFTEQFLT